MDDEDVQKVLYMFRLKHVDHNLDCQKYYEMCPICQLIVDEQTDKYLNMLESEFKSVLTRHSKYWDVNGVAIGNEIQSDVLAGILANNAFEYWLQPRYYEIEITDEELYRHPYVRQKIMGN